MKESITIIKASCSFSEKYIEVTPEDVGIANRLLGEILGTCLDELAP
ncbi:hypothetical protein WDW89_26555 [Deltaproteobacteria bacterium TL4]